MENQEVSPRVIQIKDPSTLKIKFDHGLNEDGKSIIKTRSFSNVKYEATSEDVYAVAEALVSLQEHDLNDVIKQDNIIISK